LFSIVPREYRDLPDSFGGARTGGSGIYTDIAAATSIFRGLAPLVGNPVFRERDGGVLENLPLDYWPKVGDILVIQVQRPALMPFEIDFPNRAGGLVEEVFPNGDRAAVAEVTHPVYGIGRYDATSYSGVGMINTNHPGVITISTAQEAEVDISDEERGWERRGGFQIVPSIHAREDRTPPPSMLIVAPPPGDTHPLEGTYPLFSGLIGLANTPGSDNESYRVESKIDHGEWEQMPEFIGDDPLQFTPIPLCEYFADRGIQRSVKDGVTDFRIVFPRPDADFAANQVRLAIHSAAKSSINVARADDSDSLVRGHVHVNVNLKGDGANLKYIALLIDGEARAYSNADDRPYSFDWDTRVESNGHHIVAIRGISETGEVLTEATNSVIVANVDATKIDSLKVTPPALVSAGSSGSGSAKG